MSVVKEMQFPVSVRWRGGRVAHAHARGKEGLALATPPEFRSGLAGYWTPEDLLVASAASCFALTLAATAEWHDAPLLDAKVTATGHMSRRDDGRFGFTVIEIDAALETTRGGRGRCPARCSRGRKALSRQPRARRSSPHRSHNRGGRRTHRRADGRNAPHGTRCRFRHRRLRHWNRSVFRAFCGARTGAAHPEIGPGESTDPIRVLPDLARPAPRHDGGR